MPEDKGFSLVQHFPTCGPQTISTITAGKTRTSEGCRAVFVFHVLAR